MKKTTKSIRQKITGCKKQSGVTPLVSVIMPVYNTKEEYLREAILSILSQSYKNFEFLVIDNGSNEYIKDIIKSYKDKRIKYYRIEQNQGPAFARNYGIDKATGTYIAFIDSDDVSFPLRLEKQVKFLEKNHEVGCLGTATEIIGDDSKKMKSSALREHFEIECNLVFSGCAFCQSSIMLRKAILDKYNIRYRTEWVPAEDYGLYIDLIGNTRFKILDEILVQYRFYHENTSHKHKTLQHDKSLIIQAFAIKKYCNIKTKDNHLLQKFIFSEELTRNELDKLSHIINRIIDELCKRGYPQKDVINALKKRVKKTYYHCHSLKGQWKLLMSPLNRIFKLSLKWRLMCLITRGIF